MASQDFATTAGAVQGTIALDPDRWSSEQLAKMRRFATGRVTAERFATPFDEGFEPVWAPKVAGMYVRVAGQHHGYAERADALAAGRRYRELCREELACLRDGAASRPPPADEDATGGEADRRDEPPESTHARRRK